MLNKGIPTKKSNCVKQLHLRESFPGIAMSLTLCCELMLKSSMTVEGDKMENTERKAGGYLFIPRMWVSGELS